MPKEIYNMGRSVGMSAWEIYVRQSLLLNPEIEPLSEREWLSDSIGIGTSMLLKIEAEPNDINHNKPHYVDYQLPNNSLLCAPNTIIGSFFFGEATKLSNSQWCKRVTDYGIGIANTVSQYPNKPANSTSPDATSVIPPHNIKPQTIKNIPENIQRRLMQYVKIQDAIMLQQGTWTNSNTNEVARTFLPDLTVPAMIRIIFQERITESFYLLLSGFVTRAIVKGEVGYDLGPIIPDGEDDLSANGLYKPQNGDFLGPELYPWASKVVFTYPGILTWLLREGLNSKSNHLEITSDPDLPKTDFEVSDIVPGSGIQVIDPSTLEKPAQDIIISSSLEGRNNYLKIEESPGKPTKLTVSEPKGGVGVKVTRPTTPGGSYTISAEIKSDENNEYADVLQADGITWVRVSEPRPKKGIGITNPTTHGGDYYIGAAIKSSGLGQNYIKVSQSAKNNADEFATILNPSYAISDIGVGITQPSSPGDGFKVSSIINTDGCGKNYINVTQHSNIASNDVATILNPSRLLAKPGISITQPSSPGSPIQISSKTKVQSFYDTPANSDAANITYGKNGNSYSNGQHIVYDSSQWKLSKNYIKVDQFANDSGCGCGCGNGKTAEEFSTILTPSLIVGGKRVTVTQPSEPGKEIIIGCNLSFVSGPGIGITDLWDSSGNVIISARMQMGGTGKNKNYIKIDQPDNEKRSSTAISTTLTHSLIRVANENDAYYKNANDADTEAKIREQQAKSFKDANKYLKILQPDNPADPIIFIPSIIVAGAGIDVSINSNTREVTITNTQVAAKWWTIPGDYYDFVFDGRFYAGDRSKFGADASDDKTVAFENGIAGNFPSDRGLLNIQCQLNIYSGNILGGSFRVKPKANQGMYFAGNIADKTLFQFRHTTAAENCTLSHIGHFTFNNRPISASHSKKYAGLILGDLNDIKDTDADDKGDNNDDGTTYSLINTANDGSNIWNVCNIDGLACEQSWQINSNVTYMENHFQLSAINLADGYNTQYSSRSVAKARGYLTKKTSQTTSNSSGGHDETDVMMPELYTKYQLNFCVNFSIIKS